MADPLNGLGDDPEDLLSGLPEGVVNDSIRAIDADIKAKNGTIERIDDESKDLKERMAVMVEHLKNVQQELINTQQLIEAKTKEVEAEDHLKQLAERETGRIFQDIGKMERTAFELQDRLNITQNSIFRGNERMDAFKLQMNWNQEEMEQWSVAARQKEEDNLALQKYSRADESKIKEMNLAIEKLTRVSGGREAELEAEMTETLSAQIELDKTAADFKKSHAERGELVQQWEQAVDTMRRRDAAINEAREALVRRRGEVAELRRQLDEKRAFLAEQEAENDGVERQVQEAERLVQRLKGALQAETQAKQDLQDELDVVRATLSRVASDLAFKRSQVANARDALAAKKERLEAARRRQAEAKRRLEDELLGTRDLEKSAEQMEALNKEQERSLRAMDKEVAVLKQDMFRHSQELFGLRKEEANLIAEISGAQTADRNLRDKLRQLDAESQKQQEHIYSADFQLQQMERKVARAQGEYRADEKEALDAKVAQLEAVLAQAEEEERLLKKQLKAVHDDYRRAKRGADALAEERAALEDRIQELHLSNEVVTRSLKNTTKAKDESVVQHDLLRLEVKKLRDRLNERSDQVHGLENRNFQLLKSMRERSVEVRAHKELLRADLKMAQESLHAAVMELKDREMRQATLQNKLDLLVDKMTAEMGAPEERQSPAYYLVLRAQEREELQRQGDELDARIQKAEREIRALENTLAKLTAKNDKFRQSFKSADGSATDSAARQELEARLERLMERRRAKKAEAATLAGDTAEMRQRLAALQAEEDGLRRHVRLLEGKAVQFDREREDLEQRRARAEASVQRHSTALRQTRGTREETPEEKDFRLQALREENKATLYAIAAVGEENPELAGAVEAALQELGLAPPSRPMSSRSSISSAASDRG